MNSKNQFGLASIVIVSVLVIILTLISVGFARVMDRAVNNSTNNQLGSAAYYVARSGISDASAYLAANPAIVADTCDDLLGPGKPLQPASDSLSNASGGVAKYTCILIDQTPTELNYQKVDPFKSQVVKLKTASSSASSILLSWQSSNPANNQLPASVNQYSQTTWATQKYEPMLRVTVYPVISDTEALIGGGGGSIETRARTYFLYPSGSGVETFSFGTTANGTRQTVTCDSSAPAPFTATGDYHCNLSITSLTCGAAFCGYYYLRLTPLYGQADIKIKATTVANGSTLADLSDIQAVIDVTAKANTTVRRLAARVDTSGTSGYYFNLSPNDNAMPENSIRSAGALCKRLNNNVSGGNPVNGVDVSAAVAFCHLTIP